MNQVANAIVNGLHFSSIPFQEHQTWERFWEVISGKTVFLFGVGNGAEYFFDRFIDIPLEGVIDNNTEKQGIKANQFILSDMADSYKTLDIFGMSVLDNYDPENTVILITCLKNYEEIIAQMEERGIRHNYVLLLMEARRYEGHAVAPEETMGHYVRKYCQREIEEKKIVFYHQDGYCGHGKYITEQLLQQRKDLDIVWLVKDLKLKAPQGVRFVYSLNYRNFIYELETAKVWVFDYWVPTFIEKREGQIYIQVKHWSSVTLKTFGLDVALFQNNKRHIYSSLYNSKIMDYILVGSKFDEESSRRGFAFQGQVYYTGSPRSDILFNPKSIKRKVCEELKINDKAHIIMYAPTFRAVKGKSETGDIKLDFQGLKNILERRVGGEWIFLLRLHPYVAEKSREVERPEYVIDSSRYCDSQELVAASDILITDYSSIMFEPAFVKKPVFLFAPDKREYINGERELLIDYDTLPFPMAETNEELIKNMEDYRQEAYREKVEDFFHRYGVQEDGHASERAAAFISGLMG